MVMMTMYHGGPGGKLSVGVGGGVGSTYFISIGDGEGGMYAGAVHASVSVGGDLYFISRSK